MVGKGGCLQGCYRVHPLTIAWEMRSLPLSRLLLDEGADPNCRDGAGETVLDHIAHRHAQEFAMMKVSESSGTGVSSSETGRDIIKILVSYGAVCNRVDPKRAPFLKPPPDPKSKSMPDIPRSVPNTP